MRIRRPSLLALMAGCLSAGQALAEPTSECPPPRVIIDPTPLIYQVGDLLVRTCFNQSRSSAGPIDSTLIFANPAAIPDLVESEIPQKGMFFFPDRDFPIPRQFDLDRHLSPIVGRETAGGISFDIRFAGAPSKTIFWLSEDPPILAALGFKDIPDPLSAHYANFSYINIQQPWKGGMISFMFNFPDKSPYFKGDASRDARALGVIAAAQDMLKLMDWADLSGKEAASPRAQ